jgi:BirA family biotin operon repressor/biotin-[acetyl-CoA-carboxylase] ligase
MYKNPGKTVLIGKKIISLPVCESTNSLMVSMSQKNILDQGTVIITENQTSGRGQAGNKWIAEPGVNLTFSVFLKPTFLEPANQFYLNMAIGLALCHAISDSIDNKVLLKWPNDLMVKGKKVCGILIENQIQGQTLSQSVVGIGLNLNQKAFEWANATSLSVLAGKDFDKQTIFEIMLVRIEAYYNLLFKKKLSTLKEEYYSVLYWKNEEHQFEVQNKLIFGTIVGVDDAGRLQVNSGGKVTGYNFKEIKFIQ